jgi:hypothetical protein
LYRPNLTAEQARAHAIERIVDGFFAGSSQALAAQLAGAPTPKSSAPPRVVMPSARPAQRKSVAAAAAPVETKPAVAAESPLDAALL